MEMAILQFNVSKIWVLWSTGDKSGIDRYWLTAWEDDWCGLTVRYYN